LRRGWLLLLLVLAGCRQVAFNDVDGILCARADRTVDFQVVEARAELGVPASNIAESPHPELPPESAQSRKQPKSIMKRLELPANLPGAQTPPIKMPAPGAPAKE